MHSPLVTLELRSRATRPEMRNVLRLLAILKLPVKKWSRRTGLHVGLCLLCVSGGGIYAEAGLRDLA